MVGKARVKENLVGKHVVIAQLSGLLIAGFKALQLWACGMPPLDPSTHINAGEEEGGLVAFRT